MKKEKILIWISANQTIMKCQFQWKKFCAHSQSNEEYKWPVEGIEINLKK